MTITIPSGRTLPLQAKVGGGFKSSGFPIGDSGSSGDISWVGTVAHGQALTITDAQSRFGTRANVKPLYVNLGGGKAGSSLGRDTGDYFDVDAAPVTDLTLGGITQPIRVEMADISPTRPAFAGLPFIFGGVRTPIIQYIERYYDFLNDAAGTNGAGELNLKTNRWWSTGEVVHTSLCAYQFGDGAGGNIRFYVESINQTEADHLQPGYTGPYISHFYGSNRSFVGKQWQSDEYILEQSSGQGVGDGYLIHITDGEEKNDFTDKWVTRNSSYPNLFAIAYLDQISGGTGSSNPIYYGYHCFDTEYNGVYIGNAATRGACTKLIRQPQTAWTPSEVAIQLVETHVPLSSAYLYFRTGIRSWVSESGVSLA